MIGFWLNNWFSRMIVFFYFLIFLFEILDEYIILIGFKYVYNLVLFIL